MAEPTPLPTPPQEGPEPGLPIVTMLIGAAGLLLFVFLVLLMFAMNRRSYTPKDEYTERVRQRDQQRQADEELLKGYGKSPTEGYYRIPIEQAIDRVIEQQNRKAGKAP